MPSSTTTTRLRRLPQLLLFAGFAAWYFGSGALAASAANGICFRLRIVAGHELLEAVFHLFLLVLGFLALQMVARQVVPMVELTALPRRVTSAREWSLGVALGWGLVVAALLPLLLFGHLHEDFSMRLGAPPQQALTLLAIAVGSLTAEIAFRGYPFRCLIGGAGTAMAVVVMVLATAFSAWRDPFTSRAGVAAVMLATLLLSLGWLRTHAIWFSWGLHFALSATLGLLFGLPVAGEVVASSIMHGSAYGPDWLTGGDFGPAAAFLSLLLLLGGILMLYRLTRDYAWNYTHAPILPGGYEVTIAPPAAHTAMEQDAAAKPAPLVQILATTPQTFSAASTTTAVPPPPVPDRLH